MLQLDFMLQMDSFIITAGESEGQRETSVTVYRSTSSLFSREKKMRKSFRGTPYTREEASRGNIRLTRRKYDKSTYDARKKAKNEKEIYTKMHLQIVGEKKNKG